MSTLLLVTGSRSLATREGAEAWARGLIREHLAGVDVLVCGDADGPDAWGYDVAHHACVETCCWGLRGVVNTRRLLPRGEGRCMCGSFQWHYGRVPTRGDALRHWPRERNARMVEWVAAQPGSKAALALFDGARGQVGGTAHTAALCEAAGIPVTRAVWEGGR